MKPSPVRRAWGSSDLNEYVDFPHCGQVFEVKRTVHKLDGKLLRHEVVQGITSLSADKASASQRLEIIRGHWSIENRLHWIRDVTFDEDRSQVRKGAGAQVMASLRNLAISVLRLAGATNIAATLRHCCRSVRKTLRLIGL